MNLALKDIKFNLMRFALTVVGVGFLITASVGMVGLYRGIIADALLTIDDIGADLWVVQGGTSGPFSQGSSIADGTDRRVEGVPGVVKVRRFMQFSYQFDHENRSRRAALTALDIPKDDGSWAQLAYGRTLSSGHFEAVADVSVGVQMGDIVRLGRDDFTIVGLTRGMVNAQGDGMLFVSVNDAIAIAQYRTNEEILLARASTPSLSGPASASASNARSRKVAAVLVSLDPAANPETVRAAMLKWGDLNVLSGAEQTDILLNQSLWRLRVQILAFTVVLLVVMAIVISLIVYTMTIEKLHEIAMLKLIGARNSVINMMIAQQAALMGIGGFAFGLLMANLIFPYFPRRIVMNPVDLALLFIAVAAISSAASMFGISRAMKVRAQEVLS